MPGADLRQIDALPAMSNALTRFRDSTSGVEEQLRIRIERAQTLIDRRSSYLQSEIEKQRRSLSAIEDKSERADAACNMEGALRELSILHKRSRALANAVTQHNRVAVSWRQMMCLILPTASAFLTQKYTEATSYCDLVAQGSHRNSPVNAAPSNTEVASAGEPLPLTDPTHANLPEDLPKLPAGFSWIPISQFEEFELPTEYDFKKGISYSDMAYGLNLLWNELIPVLKTCPNPDRGTYEAFDLAHNRIDPKGFIHSKSLANLWSVFFDRGMSKQFIRTTLDERTGRWTIDNGRHRIKVARDLGWKFIPGEIRIYRSEAGK